MSNYEGIVSRIADIILSPEASLGLIHGIISVPVDLGYMAYGIFDTSTHYSHQTETIRIIEAINRGILNYDRILEAIELIYSQFELYVSLSKKNEIYSRASASLVGRSITNTVISKKIASTIAQRGGWLVAIRGGIVGNILLLEGMKERCIRTSRQLSIDEPEIYQALRAQDYDLLYFMFEPALKPFVEAITIRRMDGISAFNKIIEHVESKLSGHHALH